MSAELTAPVRNTDPFATDWYGALSFAQSSQVVFSLTAQGKRLGPEGADILRQSCIFDTQNRMKRELLPLLGAAHPDWQAAYDQFAKIIRESGLGIRSALIFHELRGGSEWLSAMALAGVELHYRAHLSAGARARNWETFLEKALMRSPDELFDLERGAARKESRILPEGASLLQAAIDIAMQAESDRTSYAETQDLMRESAATLVAALDSPKTGIMTALRGVDAEAARGVLEREMSRSLIPPRWTHFAAMMNKGNEFCGELMTLHEELSRETASPEAVDGRIERLRAYQRQTLLPGPFDAAETRSAA